MLSSLADGTWLSELQDTISTAHHDPVANLLRESIVGLAEDGRRMLLSSLRKRRSGVIRVGTACSGTDVAIVGIAKITKALNDLFDLPVPLQIQHEFSCEVDPFKQNFIRRNFTSLSRLYPDVTKLGSTTSLNLVSGEVELIPAVDIFVCGFSCKDLSPLKHAQNRESLASGEGTSSQTLHGVLSYCSVHCPRVIIMENVTGVLKVEGKDDQAKMVDDASPLMKNKTFLEHSFKEAGYLLHFRTLNTLTTGFPQSRKRVYMIAMLQQQEMSDKDFCSKLDFLYNSLPQIAPRSLEEFLLDEEAVESWHRRAKKPRRCPGVKWMADHASRYEKHGIAWPPPSGELARVPGFGASERELEIIHLYEQIKPPQSVLEEGLDVSQSIVRARFACGVVCCLTPGVRLFLRRRGRMLLGEEALRIQGLWSRDAVALQDFEDTQLLDLAGNAFSIGSFCSAFIVSLAVL